MAALPARNVPLIGRLMDALRKMLADGAWLPLNRDGAAGWVADDAVWLVSKRLADEVRRFLRARATPLFPARTRTIACSMSGGNTGRSCPIRSPAAPSGAPRSRRGLRSRTDAAAVSAGAPVAGGDQLSLAHARAHRGPCRRPSPRQRASRQGSARRRTGAARCDTTLAPSSFASTPSPRCSTRRRSGQLSSRPRLVRPGPTGAAGDRTIAGVQESDKQPSALAVAFIAWVSRGGGRGRCAITKAERWCISSLKACFSFPRASSRLRRRASDRVECGAGRCRGLAGQRQCSERCAAPAGTRKGPATRACHLSGGGSRGQAR
ncbi:MAG: TraI domain-containing protein, partial [Betaproteobacteria bacterium]|nr:TraI domain-containing protein [Betaproteobacteria bacterium]